jgi:hypothetical protein
VFSLADIRSIGYDQPGLCRSVNMHCMIYTLLMLSSIISLYRSLWVIANLVKVPVVQTLLPKGLRFF